MKPVAHVIERAGWDKETKEPTDLLKVALEPSDEEGHFIVDNSYWGKQVVQRVVLLDVANEDVSAMHETGEFPLDKYVSMDELGNINIRNGEISIPLLRGSGNSLTQRVEAFREFKPVTAALVKVD